MDLSELRPGIRVAGLLTSGPVEVVASIPQGQDTVEVVFRTDDGGIATRLIDRSYESRLEALDAERPWPLDGDGEAFRLASEARRIQLAHLFDPFVAIDTSTIEPLPHQIEAVYERLLPVVPLRFLLADDPGAGKTIMSGLYIRELIIRGDIERCLIVAPGSLVEQWQDELWQKFQLNFRILSRDMIDSARTGNPFTEENQLIARVDQLARNEDLQTKLGVADWDLVVVDEAHKMSAHFYGHEIEKTKRFQVGELLRERARHFLLLTATPHNGKHEEFHLFLSLLDPDRFAGKPRRGAHAPKAPDLMRRYVKEHLLTFDGRRLFPERNATTAMYELSPPEQELYDAVTGYVRTGMNRAKRLEESGDRRRGLVAGFALAALQRRLASSPQAIYKSIQNRKRRLGRELAEIEAGGELVAKSNGRAADGLRSLTTTTLDDFDFDDYDDTELEELEESAIDQARLSETIDEMRTELAELDGLEVLAARVRALKTDRKWQELRSILLDEAMSDSGANQRKLIVFSEYRDTVEYLIEQIRGLIGQPDAVVTIHGSMHREDRRRAQDSFIHDPTVKVLVATDAAGEGVNLQRANLMVNYDLPWNPNRIEQRFGRIHRIGQTRVCTMWNLVARGTREGSVFELLFKKIEQQRQVFGDQVYDVLGDPLINRSLRELLIEAITYEESPGVQLKMDEVLDAKIGDRMTEALNERSLSADLLPETRVGQIRKRMEEARARRLQPGFIRAFFESAFRSLGGRIVERESGRFEITRVPGSVRSRQRELAVGAPLQRLYERVTFERDLITASGKPDADLVAPGHPLLAAVIGSVLDRDGPALRCGTVLMDPDDLSEDPRALVYLEHTIQDGRPAASGQRTVSRRYQFVEIDIDGNALDAGHAPYLDYIPVSETQREAIDEKLDHTWVNASLADTARSFAIGNLAANHFAELGAITKERVDRVRAAVVDRLDGQILFWDGRANELKQQELAGKKPRLNSGRARRRADDLEDRRGRRLRELDQEMDLANLPPNVVGGAVVIPQGFLDRLSGKAQQNQSIDTDEIDRRAVTAVMEAEKSIGRVPTEMEHANPGYDIQSEDPESGNIYFLEVKGRLEGSDTVTVKVRQIRQAKNNPETFRLVVAIVPEDRASPPCVHYVVRPFDDFEPHFAAVSETLSLQTLLKSAEEPV